jgi:hypothetical protein
MQSVLTRLPVSSTNLASVGYSTELQSLDVEFRRRGDVYRFFFVPPSLYVELLRASSIGAYFNRCIRNRFPYLKQR